MSKRKIGLVLAALIAPLLGLLVFLPSSNARAKPRDYLLCFWNAENLFDDIDNHRRGPGDREYDPWFAHDPRSLALKLSHLSEALLAMNDAKGPDIIALAEVESVRAAELLRDALNRGLRDQSLHYKNVLMKELTAGRHIAPAIITRLPVVRAKTRLLGKRLRILEGHVLVDGKELVVLAAHWTSRLRKDTDKQRDKYGDQLYGTFKGMFKRNPAVDVVICGDFNDNPTDESVTHHLHALGSIQAVKRPGEDPLLLNLMAGKDPRHGFGTLYDRGRWSIFDQIIVSPGMLDDEGWACDPESVKVVNTLVRRHDRLHRPWHFGNRKDKHERGYSDHFPVTVRLALN